MRDKWVVLEMDSEQHARVFGPFITQTAAERWAKKMNEADPELAVHRDFNSRNYLALRLAGRFEAENRQRAERARMEAVRGWTHYEAREWPLVGGYPVRAPRLPGAARV